MYTSNIDSKNKWNSYYLDRVLASIAFVLISPFLMCLYMIVLFTLGQPVFYVGERLGQHKRRFSIIKFRTLPLGTQSKIGGDLFNHKHVRISPVAQFLRDTRLDELPQLINIIRGDMVFFGPRPERYEVYLKQCIGIEGYESRFEVPPGVIGVSQLCTPHSTPKTMRAKIDHQYMTNSFSKRIKFGIYAVWALVRRLVLQCALQLWRNKIKTQLIRKHDERRAEVRAKQSGSIIEYIDNNKKVTAANGSLVDINNDFIRVRGPCPFVKGEKFLCRITSQPKKSLRGRKKSAYCFCSLIKCEGKSTDGQVEYLVKYEATSPFNRYLIDQYLLHQAIVACPI